MTTTPPTKTPATAPAMMGTREEADLEESDGVGVILGGEDWGVDSGESEVMCVTDGAKNEPPV